MSRYISTLLAVIFILSLTSCETDFNPNADPKDITVVYGLLNQRDTFTYLKINKAFLGNASAYEMAQNEDFSSYGTDLDVNMDELLNGSVTKTYHFDTTTIYNKEPGIFYAPQQVLYKCKTYNPESPINDSLKSDRVYNLIIKNKKTGKIISANTTLVDKFSIRRPSENTSSIEFVLPTSTIPGKAKIEWLSARGGKRYQVTMCIHYFESKNGSLNEPKNLLVNLGTQTRKSFEGNTEMELEYLGLTYYESLKNNLVWSTTANTITRTPGIIEFVISVASDDLSTYIEVNEPSNSIVQVRPEFTNISNGIGIFSSRFNTQARKLNLGPKSIANLHNKYGMLGF